MGDMDFTVLGSVAASHDGVDVAMGPRVRRLFARLVVDNGRVVSHGRLIDAVWEGDPPAGAENSMKTYVSRLRTAIDPAGIGRLLHRDPGYLLALEGCSLDSARFEEELAEASQALRVVNPERSLALISGALDRWGGDPYGEFSGEEWAQAEAVRLSELHVVARELQVEALLAAGDTGRAISAAKSLIVAEPLRERPRELLMRGLYVAGRQPEALREYRSFRRMLADDLGLDPSMQLAELEGRIAVGDDSVRSTQRPIRGYELGERVGCGAFAVVHRAVQPGVGREVAIKIIRAPVADDPGFVRHFEHEARMIASVEHPHVVPLYDFWREPGAACLVMRLMRGGSVAQRVRSHGALSTRAVADILRDVGPALEAAHRIGVVHRDVRPANLLLDEDGAAYLADFGIALAGAPSPGMSPAITGYAPPELLRGEPVGNASDVYGLGVTVYELLTGEAPFEDGVDTGAPTGRFGDRLPSVADADRDLPDALDDVLARATAPQPSDRHASIGELVDELLAVFDPVPSQRRSDPAVDMSRDNPYVGLHAYGERDAARFGGRARLVQEVTDRLAARPFVVVVGASGTGKSSAVRAGVLPALRNDALDGSSQWFVTSMVPGADPIDSLEAALLRVAVNPPASLREQLAEPGGLLRAVRRVLPDDDTVLLVVIDQLEELFTLGSSTAEQERFLSELASAIEAPASPLRVLATLRADHYDAPLATRSFARLVADGTVVVQPFTPAELEEAIVRPANSIGVGVEPALVAELVATVGARPGSLPLLQFALTETFRRSTTNSMSLATYDGIGGLTGALAMRADDLVGPAEAPDWEEARRILGRLVVIERGGISSRRRAPVSELGGGEHTVELVERFVAARLLTVDRDDASREPTVEVAHEALLRDWPTLRRWIERDREQLLIVQAVHERATAWWESGRDPSELGRGGRLSVASELLERRPDLLTDDEIAWVQASGGQERAEEELRLARTERDRRQNRRLRGLLGVAAVLLVLSLVGASVAIWQRGVSADREQQAVIAEAQAESAQLVAEENLASAEAAELLARQAESDAEIGRLVALAASEYAAAPDRAMLIALEANRRRDDPATRGAVQRTIASVPRLWEIIPKPSSSHDLWLAENGGLAIASSIDGELTWIDVASGPPAGPRHSTGGAVEYVHVSDGGLVAVMRLEAGEPITTILRADGVEVSEVAEFDGFVRDVGGDVFALDLGDDGVEFRDFANGTVLARLPERETYVEVSDGGGLAAAAYVALDGTPSIEVLDLTTGSVIATFEDPDRVGAIGLSAGGTLVTGYDSGEIVIRNVAAIDPAGAPTRRIAHTREVTAIGMGADGRFSTAGGDGWLRFWTPDGEVAGDSTRIPGRILQLAVDADGRTIASQESGGLFVYEPTERRIVDRVLTDDTENGLWLDSQLPYATALRDDGRGLVLEPLEESGDGWELDLAGVHPDAPIAAWEFSGNGRRVLTVDEDSGPGPGGRWAVSDIDGSRSTGWPEENFVNPFGDARTVNLWFRLDWTGTRIYVVTEGTDETWRAAWFDAETGAVIEGPTEVPPGLPLTLRDGTIVHAKVQSPMTVMEELGAEPLVVEGIEGVVPKDHHPASNLVLVGGGEGVLAVVDAATGHSVPLVGLAGEVAQGAFSPDGSMVAAVSPSAGVQLFDVATGQAIGVPMVPAGRAAGGRPGIRWTADGSGVWVAPSGGPVRFVTDPAAWRDIACEVAGRDLTAEEWRTLISDTEPQVAACT